MFQHEHFPSNFVTQVQCKGSHKRFRAKNCLIKLNECRLKHIYSTIKLRGTSTLTLCGLKGFTIQSNHTSYFNLQMSTQRDRRTLRKMLCDSLWRTYVSDGKCSCNKKIPEMSSLLV